LPLIAKMARDMTDKDILKMELEQLQKEVSTHRTAVSICYSIQPCKDPFLSAEDPLIKGVPEDKNPFKEKGGCIIS
uniref:Guanine nucleotide-binding protein subunit gamma n=1 Tax=Electrophorus electricus TaxID=8005 RepID=A0A4W4E7J1_ELEEL